ncbi:MAG: hypothetical protein GXP03_09305, partial [Alphaproteobacteria bacterium]|nr:hypothetical protein [Alphaproteobacteria bacterium]
DFVLYNDDIKPQFMVRPTRIAIQNFVKAIDASIARAKSIGNCDTDGLLQLTGHGFDVLVATLEPKLMRSRFNKELNRLEIEPDTLGRAWVRGLATTAAAVRTQREYSSVDTDFSVAIAAVILSGGASALFGEGLAGMAAALAVDMAASSITTPATWLEYLRSQKELEFALGAAAVLGVDRLDTAELEAVDWYDAALATYLEVAGIALGAAGDSIAAIKAARGGALSDMVARGEKLAASLAGDGARKLSVKEAADLGAFLSQAKNTALKSGTGALSDVQKNALAAVEEASSATRLVDDLPPPRTLASAGDADGSLGDLSGGFGNGSGLPDSGDFGDLGAVDDLPDLGAMPGAMDAEDFTETLRLNTPPGDAADLTETLDLATPPRSADDFTSTEILPAPPRADAEDLTEMLDLATPPRSRGFHRNRRPAAAGPGGFYRNRRACQPAQKRR